MILPLQRWFDYTHGVSFPDAFMLLKCMPEWGYLADDVRSDVLLDNLPPRYRDPKWRLRDKMLPKQSLSNAVRHCPVVCQVCARGRVSNPLRHTDYLNKALAPLRRFNSEIFDALAGNTHITACRFCAKAYKNDPDVFAARLLEQSAAFARGAK